MTGLMIEPKLIFREKQKEYRRCDCYIQDLIDESIITICLIELYGNYNVALKQWIIHMLYIQSSERNVL